LPPPVVTHLIIHRFPTSCAVFVHDFFSRLAYPGNPLTSNQHLSASPRHEHCPELHGLAASTTYGIHTWPRPAFGSSEKSTRPRPAIQPKGPCPPVLHTTFLASAATRPRLANTYATTHMLPNPDQIHGDQRRGASPGVRAIHCPSWQPTTTSLRTRALISVQHMHTL